MAARRLEADVELIGETSEELEFLRGENARLKAQVRWLEGKPYRSKPEKVPAGQLAFHLIQMMKTGGEQPPTDDDDDDDDVPEPPSEDDKPKKPKDKRKRRGRNLRSITLAGDTPDCETS